jgi:hypothetical protein
MPVKSLGAWSGEAARKAYRAVKKSNSSKAGSNLNARRRRKRRSEILPVVSYSLNRSEVIKKPLRTKNMSTPRNPPGRRHPLPGASVWKAMTSSIAMPLTPSSDARRLEVAQWPSGGWLRIAP